MGIYKNAFDFYDRTADIVLILPRPPSVNALYENCRGGRRKTQKYVDWIKKAHESIGIWKYEPIEEYINVVYSVLKPVQKRKRDVANIEKGLSDFLVKSLLITDDSQILSNTQRWVEEEIGENVICEIFICTY